MITNNANILVAKAADKIFTGGSAIAYLETLCPQLSGSPRIVVNCSGRGDKDVQTVISVIS